MDVRKPFDPSPDILVHGVEVNREQSAFAVACEDGFRIYDAETCGLRCFREMSGSLKFANILKTSNIIGLLGANKGAPKACPKNEVVIWDNSTDKAAMRVSDELSRPLRVLLSEKYMVPVCESGLALIRLPVAPARGLSPILNSYATAANPNAISVLGAKIMAFPGMSKGKLQVLDLKSMKSSIINAHTSHLSVVALSADEESLATTSVKGTLVRIWSTSTQSKIAEFRRGLEESAIYSMAFSINTELLALTSGKGTVHIFELQENQHVETPRPTNPRLPSTEEHAGRYPGQRPTTPKQSRASVSREQAEDLSESMLFESVQSADHDFTDLAYKPQSHTRPSTKKKTRFQDSYAPSALSEHNAPSEYAHSTMTTGSTASSTISANKARKYGAFATLPFAPRVLKDRYSVCSTSFHLPGRVLEADALDDSALFTPPPTIPPPTIGPKSHRRIPSAPQGKNLMQGLSRPSTLAQGAPPKGQIAWTSENELVVICAGRGGRWEKFELQYGMNDDKKVWSIRCTAWKAYLDEEGD